MSKNHSRNALPQATGARVPSLAEIAAKNPGFLDEVILPEEASAIIKVPVSTLASMRCRGGGPKFLRLGPGKNAPVGYTRRHLYQWNVEQTRISTSDPGPAAAAA